MIHVFFVPGMFGSMIEMVLRSFTDLDGTLEPRLNDDGSAHTFRKQYHPLNMSDVMNLCHTPDIASVFYPLPDGKLPQMLDEFANKIDSWQTDKKILIHAPDLEWAEINLLFQYHKICVGLDLGLGIFGGNANDHNVKKWNQDYTGWQDMRKWEYREWLSLFYPVYVEEWIRSKDLVPENFLIITNQALLESTAQCLTEIVEFCDLQLLNSLDGFAEHYQSKQKYVLAEYETIAKIFNSVMEHRDLAWNELSLIGEAILQNRFRQEGWEWYCDGLDILPTNSVDFSKILYKITGEHCA